jgi:hypothetical protein
MAFFTRHDRMQPYKREFSDVVVKADLLAPAEFVVTVVALIALLSFMHVIQFMAADTIHFQLVFINVLFMACGTFYLGVFSTKLELGLTIMIEADPAPGLLGMTVLTFLAEAARMFVFVLMTGITIRLDLDFIWVFFVTPIARHLNMTTA